jgi:hypothetical protein
MKDRPGLGSSLADGMAAGLIGYAAVVAAVSALDLGRGLGVLHTSERIGSALFFGGTLSAAPDPMAPVLAWNGVHLLASLAVGTLGALMVLGAGRFVGFWWAGLMLLVAVGVFAVVALGGLGVQVAGVFDWTTALVGTTVWLGAMTAYLAWAHRRLRHRIDEELHSDR